MFKLGSWKLFSIAMQKAAPNSSKTIDTVVEVGRPKVLKILIKILLIGEITLMVL